MTLKQLAEKAVRVEGALNAGAYSSSLREDAQKTIDAFKREASASAWLDLIARLEKAEAALKPFSEEAFRYEPPENDDDNRVWDCRLTVGDLRRAAEAYAAIKTN